ncbi:hypothetical protein LXL04_034822 [Taraxacum kok-saghyz]
MDVRRTSGKETGSCSKAMVPHTKSQVRHVVEVPHTNSDEEDQGGSVTQDQVTQVEDVGVVQADGGYDIEFEQEFEEQPPEFHFEMPNIDDAFHYDDYSLFAEFDANYNNADVLAGVGVEDSSVESGYRSASEGNKDGDSSVGYSCQETETKGRRMGNRKDV